MGDLKDMTKIDPEKEAEADPSTEELQHESDPSSAPGHEQAEPESHNDSSQEEEASTAPNIVSKTESVEEVEANEDTETKESLSIEQANADIASQPSLDAQLTRTLALMEAALAQPVAPNFRLFWELRKKAMVLFKDSVTPSVRTQLWGSYTDLTQEARRLKSILDEQTAFAVEQIEIAIDAVETDIQALSTLAAQQEEITFGKDSKVFAPRRSYYEPLQKELNLLNALASRINALRKELIKTNMRVRQKNVFFKRLSSMGDSVFPRRKDLIKEVSASFIDDVQSFVQSFFSGTEPSGTLHGLRAEIKALQSIAKSLTLNTRSFTQTRSMLSECWEKVKQAEKEKKKERAQKKGVYQENLEKLQGEIQAASEQYQSEALAPKQLIQQIDAVSNQMRSTELGRDELKQLRNLMEEAKKPAKQAIAEEEARRKDEEQKRHEQRRRQKEQLFEKIQHTLQNAEPLKPQEVEELGDRVREEAKELQFTREERQELELRLTPLRDLAIELREKAILQLSSEDQAALSDLQQILQDRLELKKEIKSRLEECRKAAGASGLDFEQAIQWNERQKTEKARLEKADQAIKEIEAKIKELEEKI